MDVWHPRAERIEPRHAPPSSYVGGPYRQVLHTTEAKAYTASRESYYGHQSYPHATAVPGRLFQHYPINRAARALKNLSGGVETGRRSAVQLEIVWKAGEAASMPDVLLETVRDWVQWVQQQTGHSWRHPTFYGPGAGFVLATTTARQRMSAAEWNAFDGICGHQHVPENTHWDPGAIPIEVLIGEEDDMTPDQARLLEQVARDVADLKKDASEGAGQWDTGKKGG